MLALSGELQIAFFLAAILTSSMKPWFVLNVFFCMFFSLNGYKFVSQYLALEEHAVTWDPDDTTTWRARPKFHLLQHILDEVCKGLHPKYGTIEMKHLGIQCSSYGSEEVAKPRAPKSKVNQFC